MTLISENIKYLRKKKGWTQQDLAQAIDIKRSLVGAYEEARADPRLNNLLEMSRVFNVSVDHMISSRLSELSENELQKKRRHELKILPITVNEEGKENIELVPQKAAAGYTSGYQDQDFIEGLPKFGLPNLPDHQTYRAFEISGESMLPIEPGTVVIGSYIDSLSGIKNGKTYVLVTRGEGVVYKRVFDYLNEKGKLFLVSDNPTFTPYEIEAEEVLEIWEAKAFISYSFPEPQQDEKMTLEKLTQVVTDLQKELVRLRN